MKSLLNLRAVAHKFGLNTGDGPCLPWVNRVDFGKPLQGLLFRPHGLLLQLSLYPLPDMGRA